MHLKTTFKCAKVNSIKGSRQNGGPNSLFKCMTEKVTLFRRLNETCTMPVNSGPSRRSPPQSHASFKLYLSPAPPLLSPGASYFHRPNLHETRPGPFLFPSSSGISKCLTISSLEGDLIAFVDCHGVNTPTAANFRLPTCHHWTQN